MNKPLISVGTILYNSKKYLKYFLDSLLAQRDVELEVILMDNTNGESDDFDYVTQNYQNKFKTLKLIKSENVGFAKAHNQMIKESSASYYACLNPDMFFDQYFLVKLYSKIASSTSTAVATGKIYKWNFLQAESDNGGRTEVIDTCGLQVSANHRFTDRGQGEKLQHLYMKTEEIFGASGAAMLINKSQAMKVAYQNYELFDELMFMYKEDCDLAYRLRWAGLKTYFVPSAIAYHDRTVSVNLGVALIVQQMNKGKKVKDWSFVHQLILLYKNFSWQYSFKIKTKTLLFLFLQIFFYTLFAPHVFVTLKKLIKNRKELVNKTQALRKNLPVAEMEKWFY